MKIAFLTTELHPLTGSGPFALASRDLPAALGRRGHDVTIWVPAYASVLESDHAFRDLEFRRPVTFPVGDGREHVLLLEWRDPDTGCRVILIDHPASFRRAGLDDDPKTGEPWPDNDRRWIVFQRAVLEGMKAMDLRPDIFHLNDYRTGLVPTYLRTLYRADRFFAGAATLFTIHDLGRQGIYPAEVLNTAGLPMDLFYPTGPLEFWGRVNFMKSAILFSDALTTLSATYAAEIQASEEYGLGLEGVLRSRAFELTGIPGGIDTKVWDPWTDPHLPARYSARKPEGKVACRSALAARTGLGDDPDRPFLLVPGNVVDHRAADLLSESSGEILRRGFRVLALGAASEHWHDLARDLESRHPGDVAFSADPSGDLDHLAQAGADFSLLASRHETQCAAPLISQRYGTLPVVHEAGCAADMVVPHDPGTGEGTGFSFRDYTREGLLSTLGVALEAFRDPARMGRLRAAAMAKDSSWDAAIPLYEAAYARAAARQSPVTPSS